MSISHDAIRHARYYSFPIKSLIDEITLRQQIRPDFQDNAKDLANRLRTVKRWLNKSGFDRVGEVLTELKAHPA